MIVNRSLPLSLFAQGLLLICAAKLAMAQELPNAPRASAAEAVLTVDGTSGQSGQVQAPGEVPAITLQEALQRARVYTARFQSAATDALLAREDRAQARAALLPGSSFTGSFLYTQGNGTPSGRFIANNGVHEYVSLANAHEVVGLGPIAEYRRSGAALALAKAKLDIAARGLNVTVVQNYYGLIVAQRKGTNARAAAEEAQRFVKISQELERGGEVAHSDVIRAELQFNERQQALQDAQLLAEKAKLDLSILLFPNFTQDFTIVDDLRLAPPLPAFPETERLAAHNNADIAAAVAALRVSNDEVTVAKSAYVPTLALDVWYGVDANQFAISSYGHRNLGYAAAATVYVPIFDWGAIRSKVKQAELRQKLTRVALTEAQRIALADLRAFWNEADLARSQLELLHNSADLAAESLRLTNLRYKAGDATALEVVDSQNSLMLARNSYDDAEARYRLALANLQTLTGTY
jgi:outer membrane protein